MFRLLVLSCIIIGVSTKPAQEKCHASDKPCMQKLSNNVYKKFFSKSTELDPMHVDLIEGNLLTLKYTVTDTNVKGFKDCQLEEVNLDLDAGNLNNIFLCPLLELDGKYVVTGTYKDVPLEGSGNYTVTAPTYAIHAHMKIELQIKDGKTHFHIKLVSIDLDPRERVIAKIDNLFNGDKEKAAQSLKPFKDDWRAITIYLHNPMIMAYFGKIIEVANLYFSENDVDDFLIL